MRVFEWFQNGGFVMYPLLICSIASWAVIFERIWRFKRLKNELGQFYLEASNLLLSSNDEALKSLCQRHEDLPTAKLLQVALERLQSKDHRMKSKWREAVERKRQLLNVDLKRNLWILGTIGSASPFIGLLGTVVGILQAFGTIAQSGKGGFDVVAGAISESLIATASGIIVAVIAVMAFNAFQTRWSQLVLLVRLHVEELMEILGGSDPLGGDPSGA